MRCEAARDLLSAALDGELPAVQAEAAAAHSAACGPCATYERDLLHLRRRFRLAPLGEVADLTARIMDAVDREPTPVQGRYRRPRPVLPSRPVRWWRPAAAAFVAGLVAGGAFMGVGQRRADRMVAADLGEQVLGAEAEVTTLDAAVAITERGWNPAVPVRRFEGTLRYRAPESLALVLSDRTRYPSPGWLRNDTTLVVDGDRSWSQGRPGCPVIAQPACEPPQPQRASLVGRPPFAEDSPAPLDLVVPAASFSLPGAAAVPVRTVVGRSALGVTTTVAQLQPLLDGLEATGNWRELYPDDRAEVWLDRSTMLPLQVTVRAAAGVDRDRWAAARGYADQAGATLLEITLRPVALNRPLVDGAFPAAPAGTPTRDAGFVDQSLPSGWPVPADLPAGFGPLRSGILQSAGGPAVAVRAWSDGSSWLEVAATRTWAGPGSFGDLGGEVRPVPIPGGTALVDPAGDRVAVHGEGIDVLVRGTAGEAALVAAAGSLGTRPVPVPASWPQAGATTLAEMIVDHPQLLVPRNLPGFRPPAVGRSRTAVVLSYTGPGARAFRLTEVDGTNLTPPLDPDARGVLVRGVAGRYQPLLHTLEWVERGQVLTLESSTMTATDLLAVASTLGPVRP